MSPHDFCMDLNRCHASAAPPPLRRSERLPRLLIPMDVDYDERMAATVLLLLKDLQVLEEKTKEVRCQLMQKSITLTRPKNVKPN